MLHDGIFFIFLISSIIQLSFYLLSILKISFHRSPEYPHDLEEQPVSIIVCAHNELENLKKLLPVLFSQAYTKFEVVVVDDRSTDDSYEFLYEESLQRNNMKLVRVDYTPGHINEKKYALTLGIKAASNEVLLFTDADCVPVGHNWINSMMKEYVPGATFLIGFSYYKRRKGFLNLLIRHETIQTALQYLTMAKLGLPYMGVGRTPTPSYWGRGQEPGIYEVFLPEK